MSLVSKNILWVDCVGAILTGVLLIVLSGWISPQYGLPHWFVVGHGCVHLAYGTYSLSLAIRRHRPMPLIKLLVFANATWAMVCLIFAMILLGNATLFAAAHFLLEGIYVGGLAFIEWKRRDTLVSR